ncbi:MAG: carboxypeptidase regulatory-like domain-containing protein, partial [Planctomycetota bacterium]
IPSVLISLYAHLRHPDDFSAALATAFRAGGDINSTGAITGVVRLEGGLDPHGIRVVLRQGDEPEGGRQVETDEAGRFHFERLPDAAYELTAGRAGYASYSVRFALADRPGPFDLLLRRGGALHVRVVGPWGAPVAGAPVAVVPSPEGRAQGAARRTGRTDRDGRLRIDNLLPGSYSVRPAGAGRTGGEPDPVPARVVGVVPGQTLEVEFDLSCAVTGLALAPDGRPLVDTVVRLLPRTEDAGFRVVEARTDAAGRYHARRLAPGEYELRLQVFGDWGFTVSVGRVVLAAGQVLDRPIRLEATFLSGRVTRADSDRPFGPAATWARVQATPVQVKDGHVVGVVGNTEYAAVDTEGRYRFVGLGPGVYRVFVAAPDPAYGDAVRLVSFGAAGRRDDVDFALEPRRLGRLRLWVLGPDGDPAHDVDFWLQLPDGRSRTLRGTRVGDGRYEFVVEAGECVVVVGRRAGHGETLALTIRENETVERTVRLRQRRRDG